jgi:hypothetical protein
MSGSVAKGVPLLRKAVEQQSDPDPMVLNDVAYNLADHNTNLDPGEAIRGEGID